MPTRQESTTRQLVAEHLQLGEMLECVREMLRARRASQDVVLATLRELIQVLFDHFEHEEAGGYFAAVTEVNPQLRTRARQLLLEHPAIAERLLALQLCAVRDKSLDGCWQELDDGFEAFYLAFAAHEAAEDTLLQEAYGDDIAAED
jgi:hypothetical protein